MSTFTQTRKVNGDKTQKKYSDTVNPWRVGRFMPITERGWSLNTYALSKVWYKSHCVPLRAADVNAINGTTRKWLYADQLVKPADLVKYRSKEDGGLGLFHVKCKSTATLIKSFLETAANSEYIRSTYHQALLYWHVLNDRTIPNPGNSPYYGTDVFNVIKMAVEQGKCISNMSCKDWYLFLLSQEIQEVNPAGNLTLKPCRVELQQPQHNWSHSWSLSRLKGLSSSSMSFLWKLLHQLLPTKERQCRILRDVNNSICTTCDFGEVDNLEHALTACAGSRDTFEWLKTGLEMFSTGLTAEKILKLDISISTPLPFNELPLIWFTAEVFKNLWDLRSAGKPCRLLHIKACVAAECSTLHLSKYRDMAPIIETML